MDASLRERVPSCEFVTAAKLHGYQLRFHKRSSDNSSKCNAFYTGGETDIIWGTVFNISVVEKRSLDKAEGLGHGYNEKTVDLITTSGEHLKAITYYAERTAIAEGLAPYTWYKDLVLNGAAEHGLPTITWHCRSRPSPLPKTLTPAEIKQIGSIEGKPLANAKLLKLPDEVMRRLHALRADAMFSCVRLSLETISPLGG